MNYPRFFIPVAWDGLFHGLQLFLFTSVPPSMFHLYLLHFWFTLFLEVAFSTTDRIWTWVPPPMLYLHLLYFWFTLFWRYLFLLWDLISCFCDALLPEYAKPLSQYLRYWLSDLAYSSTRWVPFSCFHKVFQIVVKGISFSSFWINEESFTIDYSAFLTASTTALTLLISNLMTIPCQPSYWDRDKVKKKWT